MRRKYLILFFLRRTGIIISLLIPNNFIQYSVYLASNSIHLIVFLMKKPFTSTMDSITQVITDASILSLWFIYSIVNSDSGTDKFSISKYNKRGDVIWIIIIWSNTAIAIFLIFFIIKNMITSIKRYLSKRNKAKNIDLSSKNSKIPNNSLIIQKNNLSETSINNNSKLLKKSKSSKNLTQTITSK